MRTIFDEMPERWVKVLRLRNNGRTFKSIGEEMGYSTTRARQVFVRVTRILDKRIKYRESYGIVAYEVAKRFHKFY
jgi:hypothetical protein